MRDLVVALVILGVGAALAVRWLWRLARSRRPRCAPPVQQAARTVVLVVDARGELLGLAHDREDDHLRRWVTGVARG